MINNITAYCRQVGWSPQDLTKKLRIPSPVVEQWEKGERIPPAWLEKKIFDLAQEERKRQLAAHCRLRITPGSDPKRRWKP